MSQSYSRIFRGFFKSENELYRALLVQYHLIVPRL